MKNLKRRKNVKRRNVKRRKKNVKQIIVFVINQISLLIQKMNKLSNVQYVNKQRLEH
jgi:hypothetical protein